MYPRCNTGMTGSRLLEDNETVLKPCVQDSLTVLQATLTKMHDLTSRPSQSVTMIMEWLRRTSMAVSKWFT